jgi:uncharacterized protein YegJ (DUF2314 family)
LKRVLLLLALIGLVQLPAAAWAEDPVFSFSESDPVMNDAIDEARATLPLFLENALDAQGMARPDTLIKVAVPTVGGVNAQEHIWVTPFQRTGETTFVGVLANEPRELGALVIGDQIDFRMGQVSDWAVFSPTGLLYGNYTSRVMHTTGAFGDTPFEAIFTADPLPAEWQ